MKDLVKLIIEKGICWKGYKRKKNTEPYSKGSCEKIKEDKDPNPQLTASYTQRKQSEARLKKGDLNKLEKDFESRKIEALSQFISKQVKEGFIAAKSPSTMKSNEVKAPPANIQSGLHSNAVKEKKLGTKMPPTKPMVPKQ